MINVYIDNTLVASKEQTEIKYLGAFVLGILNSSDVGFALCLELRSFCEGGCNAIQ